MGVTDLVPLVRDYFSKSDLGPWVKMEGEGEGRTLVFPAFTCML